MTALCASASATSLIPGDPEQVDWLAREYARYAAGACDAARALRRIDTGSWIGPAGEAFRQAIGEVPDKLERGQSSFARASRSLADYARVLRDAQADAAAAVRRYADADAATAAWRRLEKPPPHDPGADDRAAAAHVIAAARERVEAAARRAAGVLEDAGSGAPREPGLLSKAVDAVGSFLAGAGEATWGLVEFAYKMSPSYALIDPAGYVEHLEQLGKGLVYGVQNPKEFGKAILDWDTWAEDPARALGHLVPDLLLTIATAGSGGAGVAAGRAAKAADGAADLSRSVGAAARLAKLNADEVAFLERRFANPIDDVLEFQSRPPYSGVDPWTVRILKPGDTFSIGTPGPGRFAAAPEAVAQVGTDAQRYNEGLQVSSRLDPVDGVPRYRDGLNTYEVKRHLPVGDSIAQANPRFGSGGLPQYFLPDRIQALVDEGFVGQPTLTQMTNVEAKIRPEGLPMLEPVPTARIPGAGDGTLAAAGSMRTEGCG